MPYPFQAKSNKDTQLIILWGNNVPVAKGQQITVHGEQGIFGTVGVGPADSGQTGAMLRTDYDAM